MDLRVLAHKDRALFTPSERTTWRHTAFLTQRITAGDRLVLQFERPLRKFLVAEVTDPGYEFDGAGLQDFNHMLHCTSLTPDYLWINARIVPLSLRHALSKRGHYYEIYGKAATAALDRIIHEKLWSTPDAVASRTQRDELDAAYESTKRRAIEEISTRWPSTNFERFCASLCERIENVAVKELKDTHQGWDMLLQLTNPVTNEVLMDDVPVQCKNYRGAVDDDRPIDDLVRCIEKSHKSIAYLFILGDLSPAFEARLEARRVQLEAQLEKDITFEVVDQDTIAELYLQHASELTSDS